MKKITKIGIISFLVFTLTFAGYFGLVYKNGQDFPEFKQEILEEIQTQIQYASSKKERTEFETIFTKLKSIENEDDFFIVLDNFEVEDPFEEIHFPQEKTEILKELVEEINEITDENMRQQMQGNMQKLKQYEDEDKFFRQLEDLYKTLDEYYEENGIEIEGFSFEEDREYMLEDIQAELGEIEDTTLKIKIEKDIGELEYIENEDEFFEKYDSIIDKIDIYFDKDIHNSNDTL